MSQKNKTDKTPKVHQRNKLDFDLQIRERHDLTENQVKLIDLIMSKSCKMVFVDGPAGTSKTFLAVLCGLKCLQAKTHSDIIYVRSIIESASKSLGALPGTSSEKMDPFLMPLYDKLDELLPTSQVNGLVNEKRVVGIPINYLRGASYNAKVVIADEIQNLDFRETTTLISRLGEHSKMILVGDRMQSDINGKSGFKTMMDIFDNPESQEQGIYCFKFGKEDIVRSGVLKFIVEKLERHQREIDIHKALNHSKPKEFSNGKEEIWTPTR